MQRTSSARTPTKSTDGKCKSASKQCDTRQVRTIPSPEPEQDSSSSEKEQLSSPTNLRLLFISNTRIIIGWDFDQHIENYQFSVNIKPLGRSTNISIDTDKKKATITALRKNRKYSIAVRSFKQYKNSRTKSEWSDRLEIWTNSSPTDWSGHKFDYFIANGGMTSISANCDSECTEITFEPPTRPDIWHGYVYHLFFFNGQFKVSTEMINQSENSSCSNDSDDGNATWVVNFQYPAQCDGVDIFEDCIIDGYTICSKNNRRFTKSQLRQLIENNKNKQGCQKFKVIGDRPWVDLQLKVMYIDTFSLFENKEYRQNFLARTKEILQGKSNIKNKNKNKNKNNNMAMEDAVDSKKIVSFSIAIDSRYTYQEFIQCIKDSPHIIAAKDNFEKNGNISHNTMINVDKLICVRYELDGWCGDDGEWNLVCDNYLPMIRKMYQDQKLRKETVLFVAFGMFAPQVVNVSGGNRNVTFKICNKQNKVIQEQKRRVLVSVVGDNTCYGSYDAETDLIATIVDVNGTQRWSVGVYASNGFQAFQVSVQLEEFGDDNDSDIDITSLVDILTRSDITTVYAEIKGNSIQDHLIRAINNAQSMNDTNTIFRMCEFCDAIEKLPDTCNDDGVYFKVYYDDDHKGQHESGIIVRKENIINQEEFKQPIINDAIKQAMINNQLFRKQLKFVKYFSSIIDESAPNSKENLSKLIDSLWVYDECINKLEKENCNLSKKMLFEIMNQRVSSLCGDRKDNIDEENEDDINIEVNAPFEANSNKLKHKMSSLQKEYNQLLFQSQRSRKLAIKGRKSVKYSILDIVWNDANAIAAVGVKDYGSRTKSCNEYKKILNLLCKKENPENGEWYLEIG